MSLRSRFAAILSSALTLFAAGAFAQSVPSDPTISTDLNGDQRGDIVWHNAQSGQSGFWSMYAAAAPEDYIAGPLGYKDLPQVPAGFELVGTGRFSTAKTCDVVWFNPATQKVVIWNISNGVYAGSQHLSAPAGWTPVSTGNYVGDLRSEILWFQQSTRSLVTWTVWDGSIVSSQWISLPDLIQVENHMYMDPLYAPFFVQAADFNSDGRDELAFIPGGFREICLLPISDNGQVGTARYIDLQDLHMLTGAADYTDIRLARNLGGARTPKLLVRTGGTVFNISIGIYDGETQYAPQGSCAIAAPTAPWTFR